MQGGARGCKEVQGVTSGAKPAAAKPAVAKPAAVKLAAAKPAVAKPAAVKADYSRPMQTKADKSDHGRLWHSDICGARSISDAFFLARWQLQTKAKNLLQRYFLSLFSGFTSCKGFFYSV